MYVYKKCIRTFLKNTVHCVMSCVHFRYLYEYTKVCVLYTLVQNVYFCFLVYADLRFNKFEASIHDVIDDWVVKVLKSRTCIVSKKRSGCKHFFGIRERDKSE